MAKNLGLVDAIQTSDEYLVQKTQDLYQVIRVSFESKPSLSDKISEALAKATTQLLARLVSENSAQKNV